MVIPMLGLGTWRAVDGVVTDALKCALKEGYKHIDCAHIYGNEAEIGDALASCPDFKREEVFITSKLWNDDHYGVEKALDLTLKNLRLAYLDLYLIHWPVSKCPITGIAKIDDAASLKHIWKDMENLVDSGRVS